MLICAPHFFFFFFFLLTKLEQWKSQANTQTLMCPPESRVCVATWGMKWNGKLNKKRDKLVRIYTKEEEERDIQVLEICILSTCKLIVNSIQFNSSFNLTNEPPHDFSINVDDDDDEDYDQTTNFTCVWLTNHLWSPKVHLSHSLWCIKIQLSEAPNAHTNTTGAQIFLSLGHFPVTGHN